MPGKVYNGIRDGDWEVFVNGHNLSPQRSQRLRNHSPDGFSWGYGGSGPAQLALAILLDYLNDEQEALKLYQDFKWRVIAQLPQEKNWQLIGKDIDKILEELKTVRSEI